MADLASVDDNLINITVDDGGELLDHAAVATSTAATTTEVDTDAAAEKVVDGEAIVGFSCTGSDDVAAEGICWTWWWIEEILADRVHAKKLQKREEFASMHVRRVMVVCRVIAGWVERGDGAEVEEKGTFGGVDEG